jgi:hypothetical protein
MFWSAAASATPVSQLERFKKTLAVYFYSGAFSLTLTLSRWEREQQLDGFPKIYGSSC